MNRISHSYHQYRRSLSDRNASLPAEFLNGKFEKYIYYPAFATQKDLLAIERWLSFVDGVYAENYSGIVFACTHGTALFIGTGCNLSNRVDVQEVLRLPFVTYYAVSKELNATETNQLTGEKAFC